MQLRITSNSWSDEEYQNILVMITVWKKSFPFHLYDLTLATHELTHINASTNMLLLTLVCRLHSIYCRSFFGFTIKCQYSICFIVKNSISYDCEHSYNFEITSEPRWRSEVYWPTQYNAMWYTGVTEITPCDISMRQKGVILAEGGLHRVISPYGRELWWQPQYWRQYYAMSYPRVTENYDDNRNTGGSSTSCVSPCNRELWWQPK